MVVPSLRHPIINVNLSNRTKKRSYKNNDTGIEMNKYNLFNIENRTLL